MKPVKQTKLGPPDGNCFAACVASIFEVPLDDVPNFIETDNWQNALDEWLNERGMCSLSILPFEKEIKPRGYSILSGIPREKTVEHCVVAWDGVMVWDPSPTPLGVEERKIFIVFCATNPASIMIRSEEFRNRSRAQKARHGKRIQQKNKGIGNYI